MRNSLTTVNLFFPVLGTLLCILQGQELCSLQENCDNCISAGIDCFWCADMTLTNSTNNRCMQRNTANSCSYIQDRQGDLTILQDDPFSEQVQVRPQRVRVRLRPGEALNFNATVKPAPNFPLDLYYLMDLSYSMRDDLDNLRRLSTEIATRINNISSDSQLGFGSFVDKPISPFIRTDPVRLAHPCGNDQCIAAYSFRHVLNLTKDADTFRTLIDATEISGNLDLPEGGMDALLQVRIIRLFLFSHCFFHIFYLFIYKTLNIHLKIN